MEAWPGPHNERVDAILDTLSTHRAADVLPWALTHPRWEFVFQPLYADYLNLIEPWWTVLRARARKGRRFDAWEAIEWAMAEATAYWNTHRHPAVWGGRKRRASARRAGLTPLPLAV